MGMKSSTTREEMAILRRSGLSPVLSAVLSMYQEHRLWSEDMVQTLPTNDVIHSNCALREDSMFHNKYTLRSAEEEEEEEEEEKEETEETGEKEETEETEETEEKKEKEETEEKEGLVVGMDNTVRRRQSN